MWRVLLLCVSACGAWRAGPLPGGVYSVHSEVMVSEEAARDRQLNYKLTAELTLRPEHRPAQDDDQLLHYTVSQTHVWVRGVRARSEWQETRGGWGAREGRVLRDAEGRVKGAWGAPGDPAALAFERALLSLLQFAPADGERNETDVSGACEALYEPLPQADAFRKVKRRCPWERGPLAARRVARYEGDALGVRAARAEEVLTLSAGAAPPLKARSWIALARLDRPPPPAPARSLADATAALPPDLARFELPLAPEPPAADREDLERTIEECGAALGGEAAGEGGGAAAASDLLRLLPALRAAPRAALAAALSARASRDSLPGLCRALGLAGTEAAFGAAEDFLRLRAADALEPLARAFLGGLALAPAPTADVALAALRAGEEARRRTVAESALLAGAAAARRVPAARGPARDALLRSLARCADAACRRVRLLALGNLRADVAETLVAHAERGEPGAADAALAALRRAPSLSPAHLDRLARVATNASGALEVRAAALEAVAARALAARETGAAPLRAARLARALHAERSRAAHELRRVLWARLEAGGAARELRALLPAALRGWEALAAGGTSGVLRRAVGGGAALDALQVASGGVLRRAVVALLQEDEPDAPELEVEVSTRGLEALAGAAEAAEAEEARAALALSVGGARGRDLVLFEGQAELLALVWGGAGAEPSPVLRALRPAPHWEGAAPLQAGAVLAARAGAATALALDAHAAVSLWHRTARGALALRAGRAARAELAVRTPWAELRATSAARDEPALRVAFDLDFYEGVALCVRAAVPDRAAESEVALEGAVGAPARRSRRGWSARRGAAGLTLALDRRNDAACRALSPSDDE